MAIRPIVMARQQEAVLRRKSLRVREVDRGIRALAGDLIDTVLENRGAGLAAPQIGAHWRVCVIVDEDNQAIPMVNPEVVRSAGSIVDFEGCLSFPGVWGRVERAKTVTVKFLDLDGRQRRVKVSEIMARAVLHEIDHLDGVLFVDRLTEPGKLYRLEYNAEEEPVYIPITDQDRVPGAVGASSLVHLA